LVRSGERRASASDLASARSTAKIVGWILGAPGAETPGAHIQLAYFGDMAYRCRRWFLIASPLFDEKMF
jgi:hypothetical protein